MIKIVFDKNKMFDKLQTNKIIGFILSGSPRSTASYLLSQIHDFTLANDGFDNIPL